jgi:hypothetical protein
VISRKSNDWPKISDVMSRHDIDWLPVVQNKEDGPLIGIVRSEKILCWLMEQSRIEPSRS